MQKLLTHIIPFWKDYGHFILLGVIFILGIWLIGALSGMSKLREKEIRKEEELKQTQEELTDLLEYIDNSHQRWAQLQDSIQTLVAQVDSMAWQQNEIIIYRDVQKKEYRKKDNLILDGDWSMLLRMWADVELFADSVFSTP